MPPFVSDTQANSATLHKKSIVHISLCILIVSCEMLTHLYITIAYVVKLPPKTIPSHNNRCQNKTFIISHTQNVAGPLGEC